MINSNRRSFILKSGAVTASAVLTACGGGGGGGTAAAAGSVSGSPDVAPVAEATVNVVEATQLAAAVTIGGSVLPSTGFRLSAPTTVKAAPFCLGYAFRKGDVPAGKSVTNSAGTLQVTPKNTWPDGSLKFAILAGQTDVTGGTDTVVGLLVIPAPADATPLKTAKLRATEIVAQVGAGAYGVATFSGADWDAPFQTWVSGARMSSWIYRKPVGTDKHLVAWLEVRLWSSGAVEVLPWIENGYLQVADPINKAATFTFTLGKTQRMSAAIDLKHHQRTPLVVGTALSYWLSVDPSVTPIHDSSYLQQSELVPSYSAVMAAGGGRIPVQASSFVPLQQGGFNYDSDSMASAGYQTSIGLLPEHDVLHLVAASADRVATYGSVVRNGYGAGRYGIHYRDEMTNRPPAFSKYPTLVVRESTGMKDSGASTASFYTPAATGGNAPQWDTAHSPSVGYMAYLLTGRFYFKEETQFAATANHFNVTDWVRGGGVANYAPAPGFTGASGICVGAVQTRSAAWWFRSLTQALSATPDVDDPLRGELLASVEDNCRYFHQIYVAQRNNPFGMISGEGSYGDISGSYTIPVWQQDFVTAAWGMALSMGLPLSSTGVAKMKAFFAWKAQSVVGRLGTTTGWRYINGAPYTMPIGRGNVDFFGGTGPWLSDFKAAYDTYLGTYQNNASAALSSTENMLGMDFPAASQPSMWHNLQPALAYAVRHNVDGAQAAYDRIHNATNWGQIVEVFNNKPVWSVRPAGATSSPPAIVAPPPVVTQPITGAPAWLNGHGIGEWVEIPGTAGAGGSPVDAFSGFAYNHSTNEILIACAGGHSDSGDNRVVSLQLTVDKPVWTLRSPSSTVQKTDVAYYPDGKPASRHLYSTSHYIPQLNRVMLFGLRFSYGNAYTYGVVDGFNLATNTWDPAGTWSDMLPGHFGAVSVRATGVVYSHALAKWSPDTAKCTQPITVRSSETIRWPIAHDPKRDQLFTLNWGDGEGYGAPVINASRVPLSGNTQISISFNASAALTQFAVDMPTYSGMDYDDANDNFMFYCGQGTGAGRIFVVKPNTTNKWDMSIYSLTGSSRPPATPGNGIHNRFRYVPALKGFVLLPSGSSNLFFIRTS